MLFQAPQKLTIKNKIDILIVVTFYAAFTAYCYLVQYPLILPLFMLFLGIYLYYFKKANLRRFLHLGLLLTLVIFFSHTTNVYYSSTSPFYIPVAGIVMLTMLLFNDLQLSFIMGFISTIIVCLIGQGDFNMFFVLFMGGLMGAFSVRGARLRSQLMSAGLFVSITHIIILFLLNPNLDNLSDRYFTLNYIYPLAASGFISAFFVMATLKIFEILFGVLTNFSLLELSDSNQPILKRMILEAPGTYHHSLVVSNLAEGAADSISANALLARVGAYYHDIGKMEKPEYFTENQLIGGNKHDRMEPSMSRLVILNHVKDGIEVAKKNKVNPVIMDFIKQHHGTSLIYYFYQKALEEAQDGEVVIEENFRYPGPKPQTRETAIVLLADSVEGAVRSLDEANPNRIEETVKKIINNKFIDGQLDECNLTLKEIDRISSTFTRILSAMYHSRAKYPEKKNGNNQSKPSEKDSNKNSSS
ncbi:MAG: HDIG domain-containing protein [Candidatus Omnitrophica bacterium]|nr:HDIG domain-containing protein [Candidatus Omnitrophota bacterium]